MYDPKTEEELWEDFLGALDDIIIANESQVVMGSRFELIGSGNNWVSRNGVFLTRYRGETVTHNTDSWLDDTIFPNTKYGIATSLEHVHSDGKHYALASLSTKSEHKGNGRIEVYESQISILEI